MDYALVADTTFNEYQKQGEFNSRVAAITFWDGAHTAGGMYANCAAGILVGGAVTGAGGGFTAPAGVLAEVGTAAGTDYLLDRAWNEPISWFDNSGRDYVIDTAVVAIDRVQSVADEVAGFIDAAPEEVKDWLDWQLHGKK